MLTARNVFVILVIRNWYQGSLLHKTCNVRSRVVPSCRESHYALSLYCTINDGDCSQLPSELGPSQRLTDQLIDFGIWHRHVGQLSKGLQHHAWHQLNGERPLGGGRSNYQWMFTTINVQAKRKTKHCSPFVIRLEGREAAAVKNRNASLLNHMKLHRAHEQRHTLAMGEQNDHA